MATAKKESKISHSRALDEASTLIHGLRKEPDRGHQIGEQLCETYSSAPRKAILAELRNLLGKESRISWNSLAEFLKTQTDGVKQGQLDAYVTSILKVACAFEDGSDPRCCSNLIMWIVESDTRVPRIPPISKLPGGLTHAFETLVKRGSKIRPNVSRWSKLAQPSMNCVGSETERFDQTESGRILCAASEMDPAELPTIFLSNVPSLILMAGDESGTFLASKTGQPFVPLLGQLNQTTSMDSQPLGKPATVDVVPSPKDSLTSHLDAISELFRKVQSLQDDQEEEYVNKEIKLQKQIKNLQQEADKLRSEIRELKESHSTQLGAKEQQIEELAEEKATLEQAAKKLDADLKLTDENAAKDLVEQKTDLRVRIGRAIDGPVHSLVEDIQKALNSEPSKEDVEHIAISFDALHRKLIRETDLIHKTRLELN